MSELSELALQLEDLEEKINTCNALKQSLEGKIEGIILPFINPERKNLGKNTGAVNLLIQGVQVKHDLPKKVDWDQTLLDAIWKRIQASGDDPLKYMQKETVYSVPEKTFKTFLDPIKKVFEPARTVKPGKPKITCLVVPTE